MKVSLTPDRLKTLEVCPVQARFRWLPVAGILTF